MDQPIPHRDNRGPGYSGEKGARFRAEPLRGLAYDLDGSNNRKYKHLVAVEILATAPRNESAKETLKNK